MANEITVQGKLRFAKASDFGAFDLGEISVTQSGAESLRGRQTVTTAEEALVIGEVNPAGAWFICKNMSAAGNLQVRPGTGVTALIEVRPGETSGPFRFTSNVTAPFVISSAGSVDFIYLLVEA